MRRSYPTYTPRVHIALVVRIPDGVQDLGLLTTRPACRMRNPAARTPRGHCHAAAPTWTRAPPVQGQLPDRKDRRRARAPRRSNARSRAAAPRTRRLRQVVVRARSNASASSYSRLSRSTSTPGPHFAPAAPAAPIAREPGQHDVQKDHVVSAFPTASTRPGPCSPHRRCGLLGRRPGWSAPAVLVLYQQMRTDPHLRRCRRTVIPESVGRWTRASDRPPPSDAGAAHVRGLGASTRTGSHSSTDEPPRRDRRSRPARRALPSPRPRSPTPARSPSLVRGGVQAHEAVEDPFPVSGGCQARRRRPAARTPGRSPRNRSDRCVRTALSTTLRTARVSWSDPQHPHRVTSTLTRTVVTRERSCSAYSSSSRQPHRLRGCRPRLGAGEQEQVIDRPPSRAASSRIATSRAVSRASRHGSAEPATIVASGLRSSWLGRR